MKLGYLGVNTIGETNFNAKGDLGLGDLMIECTLRFNRLARDPSLWRDERSRSKLKNFACHGSPTLGSLPDKILIKIVKMAASLRETRNIQEFPEKVPFSYEYDHDFLIEVVAKISKRFRRIAAHPAFWKGNVFIYRSSVEIIELVEDYLSDATKGLWVYKNNLTTPLPKRSIAGLAGKCPNLRRLAFSMLASPSGHWLGQLFLKPLESLEELYLHCIVPPDMLRNVQLHRSLPNLRVLCFKRYQNHSYTDLPDMSGCDKMQRLHLSGGYYGIPAVSVFPRELKSIVLRNAYFMAHPEYDSSHKDVLEDMKSYMTDCKIEYDPKY